MSDQQGGSDFSPPTDDEQASAGDLTSPTDFTPPVDFTPPAAVTPPPDPASPVEPGPVADEFDQPEPDEPERVIDIDLEGEGPAPTKSGSRGPAPQAAPTGGLGPGAETERFGHAIRHYRMGVSGAALALAWARQENAPGGATVVVDREVSPLGRHGKMWLVAPESTLSIAVILRPPLSVEEADATWLLAGVAAAEGAEVASGRKIATWWPDLLVDAETQAQVGALKVEIQLGPGKVRSAVASIRLDLDTLGLGPDGGDALLEAVLSAFDTAGATLGEGASGVAAAYDGRCGLVGKRVKLRLMPKGETRGVVRGVDRQARLELESATGMVKKVAIDALRELEAV